MQTNDLPLAVLASLSVLPLGSYWLAMIDNCWILSGLLTYRAQLKGLA